MANPYITIAPTTLDEFYEAAEEQGFEVDFDNHNMIHEDGRGCFGISEVEGDNGELYVGSMNDPKLDGIEMEDDDDDYDDDEDGGEQEEVGGPVTVTGGVS